VKRRHVVRLVAWKDINQANTQNSNADCYDAVRTKYNASIPDHKPAKKGKCQGVRNELW
jgi:hypothetical protein